MEITMEIRAGEGGVDAKLLTYDLANTYIKLFDKMNWKYTWIEIQESSGGYSLVKFLISGNKNILKLKNEGGGMRFQRIPPTEKRGRVHTSTVTIAIISDDISSNTPYDLIDDNQFYVEWFSGTGKGGQHRNKRMNSCKLHHLPTGMIETKQGRSRKNNLTDAKNALLKSLSEAKNSNKSFDENRIRRTQVGSGGRDDKIRTYKFQEDIVIDHRTNKKYNLKKVMRGNMDIFWS